VYQLSDDGQQALRDIVTQTVDSVLKAFLSGARLGPRIFSIDPAALGRTSFSPENEWRKAMAIRYRPGSWKHSLIELAPFRPFRPAEILAENRAEFARRHPTHAHHESGIANTLAECVRDGVLVKVGPGLYGPAIDGIGI